MIDAIPSKETRVHMLQTMIFIRRFEETALDLHHKGIIPEDLHGSYGQEAVAVGVCAALQTGDYLASTHRCHGHCLARGMDSRSMLAELAGRSGGCCKGKGGSVNLTSRSMNVIGGNHVVGASIGLASGAALASTFDGSGRIALAIAGDGATSTGLFHETLNLASLWNLPVVFVIENNQYSISTPVTMQVAGGSISARGAGYGIPAVAIDGNDPDAIYLAVFAAAHRARSGGGPSLIEAKTYRLGPHWSGDWGGYRSDIEVEEARERDPIRTYGARLVIERVIPPEALKELEGLASARMQTAVDFVEESPFADSAEVFTDIYGNRSAGDHGSTNLH